MTTSEVGAEDFREDLGPDSPLGAAVLPGEQEILTDDHIPDDVR